MKVRRVVLFCLAAMLVFTACNLPTKGQPTENPNAIFTAAAQTVEVQLTQNALLNPTQPPATPLPPTNTEAPAVPTATTGPLLPSATAQPQATAAPTKACDAAQFITDVNIPDGTTFNGGEAFTKTWKIKNIGTCTWDTSYALVFDSGDQMGGAASQALPASVAPGQEINVSAALTAPSTAGTYRGYWRLRNPSGTLLPMTNGVGGKSFFVEIKVQSGSGGIFAVTSVTFTVTHSGACGTGKYTVQATITANGAGQVTYYWIRSDGATDTVTHSPVDFTAAGTQTVVTEWNTSATGLWMDIYIDKPNHQQFGRAALNCP